MEYLLISKLDVKHYPFHLWTKEKSPVTVLGCLVSVSRLQKTWKDAGANSILSGTAKERAGSPAHQVQWVRSSIGQCIQPCYFPFLFPQGVPECNWQKKELIFQSQKGEDNWVGGNIRWEFSCDVLFPVHSSGCILHSLKKELLQCRALEDVLTQLLQDRSTAEPTWLLGSLTGLPCAKLTLPHQQPLFHSCHSRKYLMPAGNTKFKNSFVLYI